MMLRIVCTGSSMISCTPTAAANLPFAAEPNDPRVRAYVPTLDAMNDPVVVRGVGMVHFGNTPLVRGLRLVPVLQGGVLLGSVWVAANVGREAGSALLGLGCGMVTFVIGTGFLKVCGLAAGI